MKRRDFYTEISNELLWIVKNLLIFFEPSIGKFFKTAVYVLIGTFWVKWGFLKQLSIVIILAAWSINIFRPSAIKFLGGFPKLLSTCSGEQVEQQNCFHCVQRNKLRKKLFFSKTKCFLHHHEKNFFFQKQHVFCIIFAHGQNTSRSVEFSSVASEELTSSFLLRQYQSNVFFLEKNYFPVIVTFMELLVACRQRFFLQWYRNCILCILGKPKIWVFLQIFLMNFFGKWYKILFGPLQIFHRQVCQNCILRVKRNIWRKKKIFWIIFFSVSFSENERAKSFNVLPESFWLVSKTDFLCSEEQVEQQHCFHCVQRNKLRKINFFLCKNKVLFHHFWTWVKRFAFRRTSFSGFLKIVLQLTIETIPGKSCFLSAREFFLSISDFYRFNSGLSAKIFCAVMSKLHFAYPSETEKLSFLNRFF